MHRFLTGGESHGPALTVIIEGMPAGLPLPLEAINADLARRQVGYGRSGRMKIERDTAEIFGGVTDGETTGGPIVLRIENRDYPNFIKKDHPPLTVPRPGHAQEAAAGGRGAGGGCGARVRLQVQVQVRVQVHVGHRLSARGAGWRQGSGEYPL